MIQCGLELREGVICHLEFGHETTQHKWSHPCGYVSITWPDWGRINARWRAREGARAAVHAGKVATE